MKENASQPCMEQMGWLAQLCWRQNDKIRKIWTSAKKLEKIMKTNPQ